MTRRAIGVGLLGALLLVMPVYSKKPKFVVDKTADFTQYKTFAWVPGTAAPNPLMHTVITGAIATELERDGLTQIEDMRVADLLIRYDVAGGSQMSYTSTDPIYIGSGGIPPPGATVWGFGTGAVSVQHGAIEIRLLDRAKQHVVWMCSAKENLDERQARRYKQVTKEIEDLFKDFPPKK